MKITDVPFAMLRFQYQLARLPLQLIEDRVVARMDSEEPARLFYERSLGLLDTTVGKALGAPELEQRGAALIERSDELRRAARLDAAAGENVKAAGSHLKAVREKGWQGTGRRARRGRVGRQGSARRGPRPQARCSRQCPEAHRHSEEAGRPSRRPAGRRR